MSTQMREVPAASCPWSIDDEGTYHTGCGNAFVITNGTPEENKMKFCPYCGRLLEEQ